jgi:hypothetical protein
MKKQQKRIIAFLLSLCLVISATVVPAFAAETDSYAESAVISEDVASPQTMWPSTHTFKYCDSGVTGKTIDLKIYYTCRDEDSNSSGYYITGVMRAEIVGHSGWTAVRNASISSVTYSSNHQYATIVVTFQASVGAGYADYSTMVKISSKIGDYTSYAS